MTRPVLLLMCIALGVTPAAQGQSAAPAVTGRVFDDTTGCPLGGVQVSAVGGSTHATTNTQGRYRLTDVPSGQIVLQAVHAGYQLAQTLPMTVSDSSARVDFSLIR